MPVSSFTILGDCDALHLFPSGSGFVSSGNGAEITGSIDDSATATDAVMSGGSASARPIHENSPPVGVGPVAYHASTARLGFDLQRNYLAQVEYAYVTAVYLTSVSGFANFLSSSAGAGQGSLYLDSGLLTLQEALTQNAGVTLTANTFYTIVLHRNASRYRVTVRDIDGNVVVDYTFPMTPTTGQAIVDTNAYGGGAPGIAGYCWGHVLFNADKSSDDEALHTAMREESLGPAAATLTATIASDGLLGGDALSAAVVSEIAASIASAGLLGVDALAGGTLSETNASIADGGLVGGDSVAVSAVHSASVSSDGLLGLDVLSANLDSLVTAAVASVGLLGEDVSEGAPTMSDDFSGTGALVGWHAWQASALPNVTQANGRYLAQLDDNTDDVTLFYHNDTGRLDSRRMKPGSEFICINVGIGVSAADTQTAPPTTGDPYNFCGWHFNGDLDNPAAYSAHVVAGHRGGVFRTIESKITTNGVSIVADEGFAPLGSIARADMRFVMALDGTLYAYYRAALSSDPWIAISWPGGSEPVFPNGCDAGLITYAAGSQGVPFVGTADSVIDVPVTAALVAEQGLLGGDAIAATREGNAALAEMGLLGGDALSAAVELSAVIASGGLLGVDVASADVIGVLSASAAEAGLLGGDSLQARLAVSGTLAEMGLLGGDVMAALIPAEVGATIASLGLLGVDTVTAGETIPRPGSVSAVIGSVFSSTTEVQYG